MVFLPERCTVTRRAGIEGTESAFNPRRLSLPVLAVTVRRPGEPQCVNPVQSGVEARRRSPGRVPPRQPAYAGVYIDMRLTLPGLGQLPRAPTARGSGATGRGLGLLRGVGGSCSTHNLRSVDPHPRGVGRLEAGRASADVEPPMTWPTRSRVRSAPRMWGWRGVRRRGDHDAAAAGLSRGVPS